MSLDSFKALRQQGRHAEARDLVVTLVEADPQNAELQYQAACVHDFLGREMEAVPFYEAALAGDLAPEHRRSAYLGLGSTFRALGLYERAEATLVEGLARFPQAQEMGVFQVMTQHNLGRSRQAVEALLLLLAETSADEGIRRYAGAIRFYAQDVQKSWQQ